MKYMHFSTSNISHVHVALYKLHAGNLVLNFFYKNLKLSDDTFKDFSV